MTRSGNAAIAVLALSLAGCAAGASPAGTGGSTDTASEAEWRALRTDRVPALPGSPAVSVYEVRITGNWSAPGGDHDALAIGVTELVAAGLMRRGDVDFVERRRFAPAAEAERLGTSMPPGQPAAGLSRQVDFVVHVTWVPVPGGEASAEVQLVDPQSGEVVEGSRATLARSADPVAVARAVVETTLELVDRRANRPAWDDPLVTRNRPANAGGISGVSAEAIKRFLDGLAAEERWNWEGARRGYQMAASDPSFHEARILLGRVARLRLGGTLAEN
jgi:hypothetical protein